MRQLSVYIDLESLLMTYVLTNESATLIIEVAFLANESATFALLTSLYALAMTVCALLRTLFASYGYFIGVLLN